MPQLRVRARHVGTVSIFLQSVSPVRHPCPSCPTPFGHLSSLTLDRRPSVIPRVIRTFAESDVAPACRSSPQRWATGNNPQRWATVWPVWRISGRGSLRPTPDFDPLGATNRGHTPPEAIPRGPPPRKFPVMPDPVRASLVPHSRPTPLRNPPSASGNSRSTPVVPSTSTTQRPVSPARSDGLRATIRSDGPRYGRSGVLWQRQSAPNPRF